MKKVFLICPVRINSNNPKDLEVRRRVEEYVAQLESQGYTVHYPVRDTEQEDPSGGYCICRDNLAGILWADAVHVWYSKTSMGSHFDLGMVFALREFGIKKDVLFVNDNDPELIEALNAKKSFPKFMCRLRQFEK